MKPGDLVKRTEVWKDRVDSVRVFLMRDTEKFDEKVCELRYDKLALVITTKQDVWGEGFIANYALVLYEGRYGWVLQGELDVVSGA